MRKLLLLSLISVAVIASSALGDTIHLKNGSVLKGKVTSFADDQFIVMLDTGSGRYLSKAMVYMGDVARIEFDSAPATSGETGGVSTQPSEPPPRVTPSETKPREIVDRRSPANDTPLRNTQPAEKPRETGPPADVQPTPVKEPESTQPEKPAATSPITPPLSDTGESERLTRKPSGPVKTVNVDVVGKRDWTSTGLIVKRGDRIRINASGTVTLDPVSGRTTGPEGLAEVSDAKKLMPDQPTGALIGVIGADNDDFIFIGRSSEFTAARDGLLFLSVNEGNLADNTGTYKAVIEVQGQRVK